MIRFNDPHLITMSLLNPQLLTTMKQIIESATINDLVYL